MIKTKKIEVNKESKAAVSMKMKQKKMNIKKYYKCYKKGKTLGVKIK